MTGYGIHARLIHRLIESDGCDTAVKRCNGDYVAEYTKECLRLYQSRESAIIEVLGNDEKNIEKEVDGVKLEIGSSKPCHEGSSMNLFSAVPSIQAGPFVKR